MRKTLLILAMLVGAAPAQAQDRPTLLPVRDVVVEYLTSGIIPGPAGELTNTVMVRYASDRDRLRVDGPYGRFYAIVDIDAERMLIVMPGQRIYATQPADRAIMAMFKAGNTAFRRIGAETVAGLRCTVYDAALNDRTGQVCLTDDGVLLRASIEDPDRHPELEAVRVTYTRQPERLFEIPPGFQKLDMPNLPYGMNLGPLDGPPGGYPAGPFGR